MVQISGGYPTPLHGGLAVTGAGLSGATGNIAVPTGSGNSTIYYAPVRFNDLFARLVSVQFYFAGTPLTSAGTARVKIALYDTQEISNKGLASAAQGILAPRNLLTGTTEETIVNAGAWTPTDINIPLGTPERFHRSPTTPGWIWLGMIWETTFTAGNIRTFAPRDAEIMPCSFGETGAYGSLAFANSVNPANWVTGASTLGEASATLRFSLS